MPMIAFASCISAATDPIQWVWRHVASHRPDWLILGGDNIYMDLWPNMYQSKWWDSARFADEMWNRYAQQLAVRNFRALVATIPADQVLGVWDDHDFAWNDCFGTDPDFGMPEKRKIAAQLFQRFFEVLNQRPLPTALPEIGPLNLADPSFAYRDVYRATTIGPLRVLLCDGRTYREDVASRGPTASLLGTVQEAWLFNELSKPGPFLLVTGSTMTNGSDQSWDVHCDFFDKRFRPAVAGKTILFLAGDVHENRLPPRVRDWPIEIVSSAAAGIPFKRNFAIIDVSDTAASAFLYRWAVIQYTGSVDLTTGAYCTTMSALLNEDTAAPTEHEATIEREQALEALRAFDKRCPSP